MTYQAAVDLLSAEINIPEIFPEGENLANHLRRLWTAVLVVAADVPLARLAVKQASLTPPVEEQGNPIRSVTLPADLFHERPDWGINRFVFDGKPFDVSRMAVDMLVEYAADNVFQMKVPHAVIDRAARQVRFTNATTCAIGYAPRPTAPTIETFDELELPLKGNDAETVIQLTAAHITGNQGADPSLAALHQQLSQLYLAGV